MLNHFILIKYQDATPQPHVDEFCRRMLVLKDCIPEIVELTVGQDMLHEARSWDIILVMKFHSLDTLRHYQTHAEHQAVMAFNGAYVKEVAALDFEISFN